MPIVWGVKAIVSILLAASAWSQSREAIEAQRQSVAKQREAVARYRARDDTAEPPAPACEPIADTELAPLIESAAKAQQLPPKLVRAVAAQESGFRACAVSKK